MHSETALQKSDKLPEFLQQVFQCIDKKDFEGLTSFISADFCLYFAAL